MLGQFSRGNNVYNGGMPNAQSGGGAQFGPPQGNQNAMQGMEQAMQARQAAMQRQGAGPGLATAPGQMPGGAPQADPNMMLKRQMDQAKSALQVAGLQTKNKTQEEGLKAAMERRMNQQQSQAAASAGNANQSKMQALLKKQKDTQTAATRIRNAYTVG
jgi:hypothetical protein